MSAPLMLHLYLHRYPHIRHIYQVFSLGLYRLLSAHQLGMATLNVGSFRVHLVLFVSLCAPYALIVLVTDHATRHGAEEFPRPLQHRTDALMGVFRHRAHQRQHHVFIVVCLRPGRIFKRLKRIILARGDD